MIGSLPGLPELSVQLDVRVDEFECWWGFRFWTPDQIACITAQGTLELPPVRLTRGSHLLRATVERVPLPSGTFLINAIIIDAMTTMPVAIHDHSCRPFAGGRHLVFIHHAPGGPGRR